MYGTLEVDEIGSRETSRATLVVFQGRVTVWPMGRWVMLGGREKEKNRWDSQFTLEVEPTKFTTGLDKGDGGARRTKKSGYQRGIEL